jgi:hypothetical protein
MLHDRYRADRIFSRWRVRPCYGEEIRSYFTRLVADNADCTPVIYALNMGLNHHDRQGMLEAVLRLPLTDAEKESLVQWTPTGFRNLAFCGNPLSGERLSGLRRYCVKCIEEGAYSRIWWSVSKFSTCPFHDTLLTEEKVTAHKAKFPYFGFHRGGVEHRPSLTERGSASFEGYILQKMGAVAIGIPRPLLDDHPLDDILCVVPAIGRLLGNPYSRKTPASRVEDADVGFEALGRDDDHFEDQVSAWIDAHVDVKSFRFASQAYLGHATHIWNEKNVQPALQEKLVALLNKACGRYGSLGRALRNKDLVGVLPNGRDVQRELGVTQYGLDVLAQRLKMEVERSGDGVLKYTPQIIESLATEIKSLVPISEVAVALGCTIEDANRICLVIAGKGWRGAVGVRVGDKVIRHVFRSELDVFLNVLSALPEKPADAETISVERFVRQARKASIAGTMVGVLTGKLLAYRSGPTGLRSVVLPRPPKRKFGGKPAIIGRRFLPKDAMRVTEFVAITGIPSSGIKFLLRTGHLALLAGSSFLSRSSAITFHQRYVNLARYSALGTIIVGNALSLSKYGLTTAFAYRDVGRLIVERSALTACIGPLKEYSTEEQRRWKELRRAGAKNCPSFLIPSIMGDGDMIVYTSSRKLFFRVLSLPEALIFKLRLHPGESPRALRIYRANEEAIRRLLTSFTWIDEDGATVIQATAKTSTEIESITLQLGELTGFFRYKMP